MKTTWDPPCYREFEGASVILRPYDAASHGPALYEGSHGSLKKLAVWNFLFYGPFESAEAMNRWYAGNLAGGTDPLVWTVISKDSGTPVGITSLLNIVPDHGRAEIGHVWFNSEVHHSKVNTETQYLLLKQLFDGQGYRRVEWKCDSLNHPSRTTATRMGFVFEGRFRQHMVVRGKNRDSDWFAMTDKDWPLRRGNFERWLYSGEKLSLMELNNA